jgi:hypothetical protein
MLSEALSQVLKLEATKAMPETASKHANGKSWSPYGYMIARGQAPQDWMMCRLWKHSADHSPLSQELGSQYVSMTSGQHLCGWL